MNIIIVALAGFLAIVQPQEAVARDERQMYSIAEAMSTENAKEKLNSGIRFYFGGQKHPKIIKNFGEYETNKKTNAAFKSDKQVCEWVFLSALISLQE